MNRISTYNSYNASETERMQAIQGAPLASFQARAGAFFLDFFLCALVFALIVILGGRLAIRFGLLSPAHDVLLKFDLHHWYSLVFLVAYFGLSTYWTNGRTLGKRLFGIRVISLVHEKMTLWHSFERALGYGASVLEFGFGFLQYFIHPNKRTVHDRIAETIVVRDRKQRPNLP